jgi:hypothetical protein
MEDENENLLGQGWWCQPAQTDAGRRRAVSVPGWLVILQRPYL